MPEAKETGELARAIFTVVAAFLVPSAICVGYGAAYQVGVDQILGLSTDFIDLTAHETIFNGAGMIVSAVFPLLFGAFGYLLVHFIAGCLRRVVPPRWTGFHARAAWLYWPHLTALLFFGLMVYRSTWHVAPQDDPIEPMAWLPGALAIVLLAAATGGRAAGNRLRATLVVAALLYMMSWLLIAVDKGKFDARKDENYAFVKMTDRVPPPDHNKPQVRVLVAKYEGFLIVAPWEPFGVPPIVPNFTLIKADDPRILCVTQRPFAYVVSRAATFANPGGC